MASEIDPPIIVRLGGSIISHSNKVIDFDYLREFRDLIREQIILGKKIVVILGGGQTFREYRDLVKEKGVTLDRDLHWIGASVNTLHAQIVRGFFGDDIAEEHVWKFSDVDRLKEMRFEKPVVVAGGFIAGISSDGVALKIARAWGARVVYDLKKIDGVYDSDPKENPDAKFFESLSWDKYLEIIGNPKEHTPGGHQPVDVIAARESKEIGMEYRIIDGRNFDNFEKAINNEEFHGTTIANPV